MNNLNITVEQYQNAIKNALSYRQVEILQILYAFPNSTATAKELTAVISPNSSSPIIASGQIGKIGKTIATYLGVTPSLYNNGRSDTPAYFSLIGPYYTHEGKVRAERAGWEMIENLRIAMQNLNLVGIEENTQITEKLPTEEQFDQQHLYKEGKVVQVFVNRFERNQKARLKCINHYSDSCYVCGFNFGQFYGDTAKGFIHVHHRTPLSDIGKEYEIDPISDLVPVCANCHSVIHLTNPILTVEQLKSLIKKSGS